MQFSENR